MPRMKIAGWVCAHPFNVYGLAMIVGTLTKARSKREHFAELIDEAVRREGDIDEAWACNLD